MWSLLHYAVSAAYLGAPLVALVLAIIGHRRGMAGRLLALLSTLFVGLALGTLLTVYYSHLLQSRAAPLQLCFCVYFACSALLIIRGADSALLLIGLRARTRGAIGFWLAVRGLMLIAIGIPLFMSGLLVYRPKVTSADTPATVLHADFTSVSIDSSGLTIRAWWIPANQSGKLENGVSVRAESAVLVCHDDTVTKPQLLKMVRPLRNAGLNVLMVDLRGQGWSDGHLNSLGDLERRDVLAAVRWLRSDQAANSKTIFGLGIGSGGAALIAAAVDDSSDGRAIESLAVYGAFDDTRQMLGDLSGTLFVHPLDRWMPALVLPLASATVGTNLANFSPAALVRRLWPRPIFVIHGVGDDIVDFERGRALFDAASFPKQRLWLEKDRSGAIEDMDAARAVRDFFLSVQPMRAI